MKKISITRTGSTPGSELRQRQLERSRSIANAVRQELSRSRARRPEIARNARTRGITT